MANPLITSEIPIRLAHRHHLNLRVVLESGFLHTEIQKEKYQKGYSKYIANLGPNIFSVQ